MKRGLIKTLVVFFLFSLLLTGCQEKEATPAETASTDSESTSTHTHAHSESEEATSQSHTHHDDEKQKAISSGSFEDDEVEDRELSDWEGDWQSVYPYLLDGTLDQVLHKKAATNKDKTLEEYKEYYQVGYETDIERIVIKDDTMTFYKNGEGKTGKYQYHGYEILTYESGKKGVRYLFDLVGEEVDGVPKHVQFSDHHIYPTKAEHFHIYVGDAGHDALLNELDNWPTYYSSHLSGEEIAEEMNAH